MTNSPSRRTFLSAAAVGAAAVPLAAAPATASSPPPPTTGPGLRLRPQQPDHALRQLLGQVDPDRIEATIQGLVSFGTRHTLSSQDDPTRGIGAARDWLFARFQEVAATSNGRMTVEKQSFVQPVSSRIPVPTVITNVIATLRGTTDPDRVYVVTGHYDSRVTDVMNSTSDAPGADDDGSGVAAVLELARLFATRPTGATIVFAAVAGEEQGLYGSAFMAQQLKAAGTDTRACSATTSSAPATPTTAPLRNRARCGCSSKACRRRKPRSRRRSGSRSAARTTDRPGNWPASWPTSPTTTTPA